MSYTFDKKSVERIRNTVNIVENMGLQGKAYSRRHKQSKNNTPPITVTYDAVDEEFTVTCDFPFIRERDGLGYGYTESAVLTFDKPTSGSASFQLFYVPALYEYVDLQPIQLKYFGDAIASDVATTARYYGYPNNVSRQVAHIVINSDGTHSFLSFSVFNASTSNNYIFLAQVAPAGCPFLEYFNQVTYGRLFYYPSLSPSITAHNYVDFTSATSFSYVWLAGNFGDKVEDGYVVTSLSGYDWGYAIGIIGIDSDFNCLRLCDYTRGARYPVIGKDGSYNPTAVTNVDSTNGVSTAWS